MSSPQETPTAWRFGERNPSSLHLSPKRYNTSILHSKDYFMELSLTDLIGIFGVALIVIAYILLQVEKMDAKDLSFSILNSIGALMILISLIYDWNLASFLMEFIWLMISLYGVLKYFKSQRVAATHDGKED